ncbi:MAG: saccharopine dehydrogenase C-terminal domain-containing protein [Bacteroidota bacterium]|nr:saccharopine dehydrogenase C-terminal domain-containing protein [Bacteroidota bacterium]
MKNILVIGAGLSASTLIKYLLDNSEEFSWHITVADFNEETAKQKIAGHKNASAVKFDIFDSKQKEAEIKNADIVVSMLPARMHGEVAESCLKYKKNMVTASYVSKEIKRMVKDVPDNNILILSEIGVDPGIDHMSAMQIIDRIKEAGGKLDAFKSYTGGLVAPKYDNNPWNYKFTWNPRNVVLAGQGSAARIIIDGKYKHIPYNRLFTHTFSTNLPEYGEFEVYPNRDSLKYRPIYNLDEIPTLIRGTMRRPGYAQAWNTFVQLGMTDDSYTVENSENMTYREFTETFLAPGEELSTEEKLAHELSYEPEGTLMYKLRWLGIFTDTKIGLPHATPAQIMQKLLTEKWNLEEDDRDMIAMQHIFDYSIEGKKKRIKSSMVIEGKDSVHTAMSITVGLPVAIAVKMILTGKINAKGVVIPIKKDIYTPVLKELETYGIQFIEEEEELS